MSKSKRDKIILTLVAVAILVPVSYVIWHFTVKYW